jgi:hypothetical protein
MGGNDYVFFQDVYNSSEEEVKERLIGYMEKAHIHPEFIYAFKKTGLLITQENIKKVPDVDIEEWKEAINEYFRILEAREDPLEYMPTPKEIPSILEEFPKCIYIIASIVRNEEIFRCTETNENKKFFHACLFFSLKKIETNLKSISSLLNSPVTTSDTLSIARSIYEVYLAIQYSINNPDKSDLVYGLTIENSKVYSKRSLSKTDQVAQSIYSEDKIIHKYMYDYLSSYSHPDLHTIISYSESESAGTILIESIVISILYTVFILHELLRVKELNDDVRTDIKTLVKRITPKLTNFYRKYPISYKEKDYTDLIISRLSKLGN